MIPSDPFASDEPFSDSESVDETGEAIPDDENEFDQVPSALVSSSSPSDHLYLQFDYGNSENALMCSGILEDKGKTAETDHSATAIEMSFIDVTNQKHYILDADRVADPDMPHPFSSLEFLTGVHSKNCSYKTADQVADTTHTTVDTCDIYLNFVNPIPEDDLLDLDQVLSILCKSFRLPLAQLWLVTDPELEALSMRCQSSHEDYQYSTPWCNFKKTFLQMRLNKGQGLVGNTYISKKSYFCRNITDHPFAHYPRGCGSVACFTICLSSLSPQYGTCILELFLPTYEIDCWQTLWNSLLKTMTEHLERYMVSSGEQLVEVMNFSTHNVPKSFNIYQPESSHSHHEGSENPHSMQLIYIDSDGKTPTGEMSKRTPQKVAEITHLGKSEASTIKSSELKRSEEILEEMVKTAERDHSAKGMTLKEAKEQNEQTLAANIVDELHEEPPSFSKESLSQYFGMPLDEARKIFGVSRTEFKKMCRNVGIKRWQYGKRKLGSNSSSKHKRRLNNEEPGGIMFPMDMPPVHDLPVISYTSQVSSTMDIKAMHNNLIIRFELPAKSGKSELDDNLIKRLQLARDNFSIKYEDDKGHWVTITCDEDVRYCMKMSRSWKKTTINMLVDLTANQ